MNRLLIILLLILIIGCSSDPNQIYIDKVEEKVKKNDMGLDIGYRNVEFAWTDTVFEGNVASEYHATNTYRMLVGEIDQKITAKVVFDSEFNIISLE
jgi:hypothetical protein